MIVRCLFISSSGEDYVLFRSYAPHVEDGVAHTAKGRVYAHARSLGNFLERHVAVETHFEYLALRFGKRLHYAAYIGVYLRCHH